MDVSRVQSVFPRDIFIKSSSCSPASRLTHFMIRRLLRSLLPRVSAPILPLTARIRATSPYASQHLFSARLFRHLSARLVSSPTSPPPSSPLSPGSTPQLPPNATLTQRLRHLIRTYGWYALGVYAILSLADFGVALAGINLLGAEHVSRWAASIKEAAVSIIRSKPADPGRGEVEDIVEHASNGSGHEGTYAMLALAYTIHKTLFVPVRIGLTAALTPRLVAWLGKRGWVGGEGTKRAAIEMRERFKRSRSRSRD